jgi:hypothetical protein
MFWVDSTFSLAPVSDRSTIAHVADRTPGQDHSRWKVEFRSWALSVATDDISERGVKP